MTVDPLDRIRAAIEPWDEVIGWATVELDRAESEQVAVRHDARPASAYPAGDDETLGARCRLVTFADGARLLLLEPSTEGRLAGALARHGEGPVVTYLLTDADGLKRGQAAGLRLSSTSIGPLGTQHFVLSGPRDGPFVILTTPDRVRAEATG